jgi:hypothetical protein
MAIALRRNASPQGLLGPGEIAQAIGEVVQRGGEAGAEVRGVRWPAADRCRSHSSLAAWAASLLPRSLRLLENLFSGLARVERNAPDRSTASYRRVSTDFAMEASASSWRQRSRLQAMGQSQAEIEATIGVGALVHSPQ